jgi:PAS domain-containing protein
MSSVDLVDPRQRPRSILVYALVPPAAIAAYVLLELLLASLLFGGPRAVDLEIDLISATLVITASLALSSMIVARSSRPFLELTEATRAVAADPSLGASYIPLAGQPETVELACEIRALITTLSASRARHDGLLRAVGRGPVGLVQVRAGSGTILYVNPAFCRLLAWPSPAVCEGRRLEDVDPAALSEVPPEGLEQLVSGGTWTVRREIPWAGGVRSVLLTSVAISGEGSDAPSYLVFAEDISSMVERDEIQDRHTEADAVLPGLAASVAASRGLLELALRDPLLPGALRADLGAIRDGTAETARLLIPLMGRASA